MKSQLQFDTQDIKDIFISSDIFAEAFEEYSRTPLQNMNLENQKRSKND